MSYLIGGRDADAAQDFMHDVADRLANRVQLTTDGHGAYLSAVVGAFGIDVDYAQLVKHYGPSGNALARSANTAPAICSGITKRRVLGKPIKALVSTQLCRKAQPDHAPAHEAVCPADGGSFQEDRKPRSHGRALHDLVQFRPDQQRRPHVPGDGCGLETAPLGHWRYREADRGMGGWAA